MKKKRRSVPKAKGVTRIDDPGRHGVGWYARVVYRTQTFSKYFADAAHGGTRAAFRKAVAWRDAKEKEIGKPRTDRTFAAPGARSRFGIPGVYQSKQSYVVAWTPSPGDTRREFISIRQYGAKEALRRAIDLRRRRELAVYGRSISSVDQLRRRRAPAPKKRRKARRSRAR